MNPVQNFEMRLIPIREIVVNPAITPKALQISKDLNVDKAVEETYLSLLANGIPQALRTGCIDHGEIVLLANYELLTSYRRIHSKTPDAEVPCLIYHVIDVADLKSIGLMSANLESGGGTYLTRLLDIDLLVKMRKTPTDIKMLFGVKNSASPAGRQLQRDCRLVKHRRLLSLVLGVPLDSNDIILDIIKPNPGKARIAYSVALDVIALLGDDEIKVNQYVNDYLIEVAAIENHHTTPEEETKPVFQRRNYNKVRMNKLARAIARESGRIPLDEKEHSDFKWTVRYDELKGEYHIPEIKLKLHSLETLDIKKIQEVKYNTVLIGNTFSAHIARVRPSAHGGHLKTTGSSLDPIIKIPSNLPNPLDLKYLDDIRANKMIKFAHREQIFKCLSLRADHFGFETYQYDAQSTWQKAHKLFSKWMATDFLHDVFIYSESEPSRNPKFKYFVLIDKYLVKKSNDPAPIYFCDFVVELFSAIFADLDVEEKNRHERAEQIVALDVDLVSHSWRKIDEILDEHGKVTLTRPQIESLIRENIQLRENRLLRTAGMISRTVDSLLPQLPTDPKIEKD